MGLVKGYQRKVNQQFSIHIAENNKKEELQQILELNVNVHGESVRDYINHIVINHPRKEDVLFLYIKDSNSNKIVSSISLMPLEWRFGSTTIPVCEMGFVGTLEKYRGKGLIVELNNLYERIMAETGYIISVIRGIPYYYRKLGYEFAIPLDHRMLLSLSKIPLEDLNFLEIRKANSDDINFIANNYNKFYDNYFISNVLDRDCYISKFFNDYFNEFKASTYIIETGGKSIAYFTFGKTYENLGYDIKTLHINRECSIKILQFTKEIARIENPDKVDLAVREDTDLAELICELGGVTYDSYGWQVKIPNLKVYFKKIKPILEDRIHNSDFKGLTQDLIISNYTTSYILSFNNGQICDIKMEKGYPTEISCDLKLPGSTLFKLILGDRSFKELKHIIKDALVKHESRELIDVLFPKENSYSDTYY
ncbi:MAG: GNAT family N-acetyltransferase [Candidatus Lokiarchaeota archaeon]|nr:GNAT family N-acetyltransferase [Candidatus Lokiarchaeota archaeon]